MYPIHHYPPTAPSRESSSRKDILNSAHRENKHCAPKPGKRLMQRIGIGFGLCAKGGVHSGFEGLLR